MSEAVHLELEALLALRDGEGTAYARSHVESCEACRDKLDRLHRVRAELRALPVYGPGRDLWPRVAAEVKRRRARRLAVLGLAGLAVAATLAGWIVARGAAQRSGAAEPDPWAVEITSRDLGPVILRSRELETMLDTYQPARRVYDVPTALAVSVLEDRIALLDRMLAESHAVGANREMIRGLWGERVVTLEKLVGLELGSEDGGGRPSEAGGVWR